MAQVGYFFSQTDYDGEVTSTRINATPVTAANFDAQMTAWQAVWLDLSALALGRPVTTGFTQQTRLSNEPADDTEAQRELKWLIRYQDAVTYKLYTFELGCADTVKAGLLLANTDKADMDSPEWTELKTTFEAFALSPAGNAVELLGATLVGRNF